MTERGQTRRKIMLVEDSPLVLMTLVDLFEDMDWAIDGPATRLADALALAETTDADIVLLDVNLDGEFSWEVADRLKARGIQVVFATGYDSASLLPQRLTGMPVVSKPFTIDALEAMLRRMVGDAG